MIYVIYSTIKLEKKFSNCHISPKNFPIYLLKKIQWTHTVKPMLLNSGSVKKFLLIKVKMHFMRIHQIDAASTVSKVYHSPHQWPTNSQKDQNHWITATLLLYLLIQAIFLEDWALKLLSFIIYSSAIVYCSPQNTAARFSKGNIKGTVIKT